LTEHIDDLAAHEPPYGDVVVGGGLPGPGETEEPKGAAAGEGEGDSRQGDAETEPQRVLLIGSAVHGEGVSAA
jgi:hypothetical protein